MSIPTILSDERLLHKIETLPGSIMFLTVQDGFKRKRIADIDLFEHGKHKDYSEKYVCKYWFNFEGKRYLAAMKCGVDFREGIVRVIGEVELELVEQKPFLVIVKKSPNRQHKLKTKTKIKEIEYVGSTAGRKDTKAARIDSKLDYASSRIEQLEVRRLGRVESKIRSLVKNGHNVSSEERELINKQTPYSESEQFEIEELNSLSESLPGRLGQIEVARLRRVEAKINKIKSSSGNVSESRAQKINLEEDYTDAEQAEIDSLLSTHNLSSKLAFDYADYEKKYTVVEREVAMNKEDLKLPNIRER